MELELVANPKDTCEGCYYQYIQSANCPRNEEEFLICHHKIWVIKKEPEVHMTNSTTMLNKNITSFENKGEYLNLVETVKQMPLGSLGRKDDSSKRQWWFLWQFLPDIGQVVDILAYGNEKYPAEDGCNWRNVPQSGRRYSSALMRHLSAYLEGEKNDPETGKSHLAHMITNALFLMWFDRDEGKNP